MVEHVLDQFRFVPHPLPLVTPSIVAEQLCSSRVPDSSVHLSANGDVRISGDLQRSPAATRLQVPLVVRGLRQQDFGPRWAAFCAMLREQGIPVCCPASDLESLPIETLPLRIGRRLADQGFDHAETDSSDAFELDFRDSTQALWSLPSELGARRDVRAMVVATRQVLDSATPLGIVLPTGVDEQDLNLVLDADIDFITLVGSMDDTTGHLLVSSLAQISEACQRRNLPLLPIMVDATLPQKSHISTCLALGASVIAIDGLLGPIVSGMQAPEAKPIGGGMLSSISAPSPLAVGPIHEIAELIAQIVTDIKRRMQFCGATKIRQFDRGCLRAITEQAATLAGVRGL